METMDELKIQLAQIQDKIYKIEKVERRAEMETLLGKYFKYRNCYSCPDKPSDYWWMYSMPIRIRKDGWFDIFQFEMDKDGKISIETKDKTYRSNYYNGWKEISQSNFNQAWKQILERVKRSKP